jgi:hypothetical protein
VKLPNSSAVAGAAAGVACSLIWSRVAAATEEGSDRVDVLLHALNHTEAQKQKRIRINIVSVLSPGFKVTAWAFGRPGNCAALVLTTR